MPIAANATLTALLVLPLLIVASGPLLLGAEGELAVAPSAQHRLTGHDHDKESLALGQPHNRAASASSGAGVPSSLRQYSTRPGMVFLHAAHPKLTIEVYLSLTDDESAYHWSNVVHPLITKFYRNVSIVIHWVPVAQEPYSYDAMLSVYAYYNLIQRTTDDLQPYIQMVFDGRTWLRDYTFNMARHDVWDQYFKEWAIPQAIIVPADDLLNAMAGRTTSAVQDTVQAADFALSRAIPGLPTYAINGWEPANVNLREWDLAQWEQYVKEMQASGT